MSEGDDEWLAECALCRTTATTEPLGLISSSQGPCICRRCCELAWAVGWDSNPRFTTSGSCISVDEQPDSACHECACGADQMGGGLIGTPEMRLCRGDIEQFVRTFDDLARHAAFGLQGSYFNGKRID